MKYVLEFYYELKIIRQNSAINFRINVIEMEILKLPYS